jgi:hypothetical protein
MLHAGRVARNLQGRLRAAGIPDAHGARPFDIGPAREVGGRAAELAAARYYRVAWTSSRPDAHRDGPDIGRRTQVRHIGNPTHSLIVRPREIERYGNVPFVLVFRAGRTFTIRGWVMAYEARRVGRWTNAGRADRPPAWFVAQGLLRPAEELIQM